MVHPRAHSVLMRVRCSGAVEIIGMVDAKSNHLTTLHAEVFSESEGIDRAWTQKVATFIRNSKSTRYDDSLVERCHTISEERLHLP